MDFSSIYFNKSLIDLEYIDIVNFFKEEKEESTNIEFKSFNTQHGNFNLELEKNIIKTISAFLNSDGGILIWGAPVGSIPTGGSEKVFKGDLSPLPDFKEKDWLINKISDNISPLPIGIKVKVLQDNSNYLYIFEVQKSSYLPHQYKDTYYARLDGQTKPAPHYLIEALFKKIQFPNIQGFIKIDRVIEEPDNFILIFTVFIFNFSQLQNEEEVWFHINCTEGVFTRVGNPNFSNVYRHEGHQAQYPDQIKILHFGTPFYYSESINVKKKNISRIELILAFGGKKSPAKNSSYTLDLGAFDSKKTTDLNYLISNLEENVFLSDLQERKGRTREETLKEILNR